MVDLTGNHDVKAICPRCGEMALFVCRQAAHTRQLPQCDSQGEVWLPANQCRTNIEGGIEPRWMKSGETI